MPRIISNPPIPRNTRKAVGLFQVNVSPSIKSPINTSTPAVCSHAVIFSLLFSLLFPIPVFHFAELGDVVNLIVTA